MFVSVIIPTKNEPAISIVVKEVNKYLKNIKHEIIIVDKSNITPTIKNAKVLRQKSDGLGNAIVEGVKKAKGDVIVTMDGDGSHNPKYILDMLKKIGEYDIIIGSKFVPGGGSEDPLSRVLVSEVFRFIPRIMLGVKVKDPMSGFAAIKRSVFNKIHLEPKGYKIIIEIVYKSKAKVYEIPIIFRRRYLGETKVGYNLRGIKEVITISRLLWRLRFKK
jgi:dolichol-phosphate mannosyltransferase